MSAQRKPAARKPSVAPEVCANSAPGSESWKYEDVLLKEVGVVRLTGDLSRVILMTPSDGSLSWRGTPFRVSATWRLDADGSPDLLSFILGRPAVSLGLDDDASNEVQDFLDGVVAEWVADSVSMEMLRGNVTKFSLSASEERAAREVMAAGRKALSRMADPRTGITDGLPDMRSVLSATDVEQIIREMAYARALLLRAGKDT